MKKISEEDILLMGWSEEDFKRFKDCRCDELRKALEKIKQRITRARCEHWNSSHKEACEDINTIIDEV